MDSNEFYDWIKDTLNRGDTLNSSIPRYVQAAVRRIERRHPFADLEWWADFTLLQDTDQIINLPERTRDIVFLRLDVSEGASEEQWHYVMNTDPKRTVNRSGTPRMYWLNENRCLVLDAVPDKDFPAQLKIHQYSNFPEMGALDGTEHWLLRRAPDALHAQVMYMMSPFIREDDPNIAKDFRIMAQQGVQELIMEDAYNAEANQPAEMTYWPQHLDFSNAYPRESD